MVGRVNPSHLVGEGAAGAKALGFLPITSWKSACVTLVFARKKGGEMVTLCRGFSSSKAAGSVSGEPIWNEPAATATVSTLGALGWAGAAGGVGGADGATVGSMWVTIEGRAVVAS